MILQPTIGEDCAARSYSLYSVSSSYCPLARTPNVNCVKFYITDNFAPLLQVHIIVLLLECQMYSHTDK